MAGAFSFRFDQMRSTANEIRKIGEKYGSAANEFSSDFVNATKDWEGASKEKMTAFITGSVHEYLNATVPRVLDALAELLENNANEMEKADQQIADAIPKSLGS